jgi:NodT family efflux transporter outer membrane factor (OMF) lipoprotein
MIARHLPTSFFLPTLLTVGLNLAGLGLAGPSLLGLSLVGLSLSGCVQSTSKAHTVAITPAQAGLTDADATPVEWPAAQWWQSFADPQLDSLITEALAGSPTMEVAAARVRQAQQAAIATRAIKDPALAVNAEVNRQRYSENYIYPPPLGGSSSTDSRLALDFSYEFDFWGRQQSIIDAARTQLAAEQAEHAAAQLVLSVSVAQSYFSLQHGNAERKLVQNLVQQREAALKLQQLRAERGLIGRGETQTPIALLADAKRELAVSTQYVDLRKHQLAALIGRGPATLNDLNANDAANEITIAALQQLPADLLARRADITAQRLRIEAASADIETARADFYPNIDLSAFIGVQALGTQNLLQSSSKTYGVGPALHLPIFYRDGLRARLGARYADYDIAVAQYNESVLAAAREVADAGSILRSIAQQRSAAANSLQALQQNRDLAQLRHRQGLGNYLDVLTADNALIMQQRSVAALRDDQLQATLALIKALGGGYQPAAPAAAVSNEASND